MNDASDRLGEASPLRHHAIIGRAAASATRGAPAVGKSGSVPSFHFFVGDRTDIF
jgi:hypothetical protein